MSLLESLDSSSQLRKNIFKLKNRVLSSKKTFLLAPVVVMVMVFSATNLPSAQKSIKDIVANKSVAVEPDKRVVFPFEPIPQNELFKTEDVVWKQNEAQKIKIDKRENIVKQFLPDQQTQLNVQVAKIDRKLAAVPESIAIVPEKILKYDNMETKLAVTQEAKEEPLKELKVLRTVKVAEKKLKVFKKDLTILQTWRYAVQVAAIYGEDLADDLVDYLASKGYSPVIWESEDKKGNKFQRIWIGLYQNSEKADMAREYYTKHENKQAFVTTVAWDTVDQSSTL
jgi:cell division septation protein DedD